MNERLLTASRELEAWITGQALPLWATTGFNTPGGVSHERLCGDGTPDLSADLRVRVQARQLFVYALAAERGWYRHSRARAEAIFDSLERLAVHPRAGGGYIHLLNSRLEAVDLKQDLYDHAFLILAFVWYYRAFGVETALQRAGRTLEHLDKRFGSGYGGWLEGDYAAECRRQNPHMHLFEAFLAGYDATGDRRWLDRAGEVFSLFERHFYDPDRRVLWEFFNDDWSRLGGERGEIVEPGHLMEWVWLLRCYEHRTGRSISGYADTLYDRGIELGLEPVSGLLYDQVRADGSLISATKRCWPMTELIKASLAQARAGYRAGEERAAQAIEALMRYYLDTLVAGAYIDQRGADNEVVVDITPASTLYHLAVAAAEAAAYCRGHDSD